MLVFGLVLSVFTGLIYNVHWFFTQTQIMLARDSTGRKKFLVWESEENEFETLFEVLIKCTWN